ncbi:MAG: hypothetical protein DSZ08_01355 [Sulfurovum sp.]|nr:MAG: hypothetical protein DSZ08_01355 [Sulfurovum sp.]
MMQEIIDKINLHKSRAKLAQKEIRAFDNELSVEIFEDFEKVKTIDTFIYRFIKFQDMMGEKLFRFFLDELGEYKESMSLLDILDKLEKLGFIDDAMQWMQYRKLRNKLTHEYPNNEDEIVEGIILALQTFDEMEAIFNTIVEYKKV